MSLNDLRKKLNKKIDDDVVFVLMEDSVTDVETWVSTGCTELDMIISNSKEGGIPIGKITEITGQEATGKSLMAMQIMANAQKAGGLVVYIDTEQALNSDFATRVGLDLQNNFLHITSTTIENVFTIIQEITADLAEREAAAKKEKKEPEYKFAIIVCDSVAATPAKADLDSDNPDPTSSVALKPRVLSKNVPFLLKTIMRSRVGVVFVNQLRQIIGAMPGQDPWIAPGGKAIPYYSSVRIRLTAMGKLRDKKDNSIYGVKTKAVIKKTRFGPPHRSAEFPIYFSYGIDDEESIVNVLTSAKLIKKALRGRNGTK